MPLRRILVLASLGLVACPRFPVGPEIQALYLDDAMACEEAQAGPAPCSIFDVDNPGLQTSAEPIAVVMQVGFRTPDRNLDAVRVQYERPGGRRDISCVVGSDGDAADTSTSDDAATTGGEGSSGGGAVVCESVALGDRSSPVGSLEGTLEIRLQIRATTPGEHALTVTLVDTNDLHSQPLRWQFQIGGAAIEPGGDETGDTGAATGEGTTDGGTVTSTGGTEAGTTSTTGTGATGTGTTGTGTTGTGTTEGTAGSAG